MKKLRSGQNIGIGYQNSVQLYATVGKIDDTGFTFDVINGAWEGHLDKNGVMTVHSPTGDTKHPGASVVYSGKFPISMRGAGYNDAIDFMEHQIKYGRNFSILYLYAYDFVADVKDKFHRLKRGLTAARDAFTKSWGRPVYAQYWADLDDDIPF